LCAETEYLFFCMAGISEYKIERFNSLVIITGNPHGGPNRKELVRRLKKATHGKRAAILRETEIQAPRPATTAPTVVYVGYPSMAPGFQPVPWPTAPVITNPNYFQRPVRCHFCAQYSDIVCANCGRGSNY
jgi:hypothetical protein